MRLTSTLLFLITAFVATLVAYDRPLAIQRFGLISLGLALVALLVWSSATDRGCLAVGYAAYLCLWGASAIALLYLFNTRLAIGGVPASGGQLLQPAGPLASITFDNATAGALGLLIPIGVGSLAWFWKRRSTKDGLLQKPVILAVAGLVPAIVALVGLAATRSRGAWLGLVLGTALAIYLGWRVGAGRHAPTRWIGDGIVVFAALALIAGALFMILSPSAVTLVRSLTLDGSARSRVELWQDVVTLIQDYSFTGIGLGSMAMVYSTYVFLLHVVYLQHAHQLYLQVAVEQGLPGLIAFLCMTATAFVSLLMALHRSRGRDALTIGATASFVALLIYGFFDAELFASGLAPLTFVSFGFAWAVSQTPNQAGYRVRAGLGEDRAKRWLIAALPLGCVAALFILPGARAALHANLGAVSQTTAELSIFSWPRWGIQDELRRDNIVDLAEAMSQYRLALALDPHNTTAHRRLGQIQLAQGDYQSAKGNLEAAYSVTPGQRATRQLLGEAYAVTGNTEGAVRLWETVDTSHQQLGLRQWWYSHIGADLEQRRIRRAIYLMHQRKLAS